MTVRYSTIGYITGDGLLVQAVRRDTSGRIRRVSSYLMKRGKQVPVSETIYYVDGTSCLHMYNEWGDVWQVSRYDKDGQELFPLNRAADSGLLISA